MKPEQYSPIIDYRVVLQLTHMNGLTCLQLSLCASVCRIRALVYMPVIILGVCNFIAK